MVKLSISFNTSSKKTNIRHNNRELEEEEYELPAHKHIIRELSKENVVLIKEPIEEVYEKLFGEALKEYNSKQKREDRKIKDYLKHIKQSKCYDYQREFIIAVGDKNFFDEISEELKIKYFKLILKDLVKDFIKNNPNLYVYNAVIHFDEQGAPHAHVNVVPFAKGYKKGLKVQPSFRKALFNQGFKNSDKDNLKNFCEKQVKSFEEILKKHGIERKIVGTNKIKDMREYKALQQELEEIKERELTEIQNKKQELEQVKQELKQNIKSLKTTYINKQIEVIEENKETITQQKANIAELERNKGQISTEIGNMKYYIEKQKGTYKHNENALKKQNDTINENKQNIRNQEIVQGVNEYTINSQNDTINENKETITQQKADIAELERNKGQISTEIKNMVEDIEKQKSLIIERVNDEIPKIEKKQNKRYEYVINSYQEKIEDDIDRFEEIFEKMNTYDYEKSVKVKFIVSALKTIIVSLKEEKNELEKYAEEQMKGTNKELEKVKKESVEKIKENTETKVTITKKSLEDRIAMFEKQEQREIKNKTDKKIEKEKGTSLRL